MKNSFLLYHYIIFYFLLYHYFIILLFKFQRSKKVKKCFVFECEYKIIVNKRNDILYKTILKEFRKFIILL